MSAVPAVIDAVLKAAAAALPTTQIFDGPPTDDEQNDRVVIGWSRNRPATTITTTPETFDNAATERFDIPNTAVSWSGDIDMKPRRDAAFAMVDAIAAALEGNGDLAAVSAVAWVAATSYLPDQTTAGTQAVVEFTVHVEALL